jgi:serine/threonine protein kinase
MGLAKVHSLPTQLRKTPSGTISGTFRYQSPEVKTSISGKRSRSYDLWSMGCILLEFIIWLLYGWDDLLKFNESFAESFFIYDDEGVRLRKEVEDWICHMREKCLGRDRDRCVSGALADLLDFVEGSLLIEDPEPETASQVDISDVEINIPAIAVTSAETSSTTTTTPRRAKVADLCNKLEDICSHSDPEYVYKPSAANNANMKGLQRRTSSPSPVDRLNVAGGLKSRFRPDRTQGLSQKLSSIAGANTQVCSPLIVNVQFADVGSFLSLRM